MFFLDFLLLFCRTHDEVSCFPGCWAPGKDREGRAAQKHSGRGERAQIFALENSELIFTDNP